MSRVKMGFQIFLMLVFFTAMEVEANPLERCESKFKFAQDELHHMVAGEEELGLLCNNVTSYLTCVNAVCKEETGYDLKEMADVLQGTQVGKALRILVNIESLIHELCTEGNQFREDYLAHSTCFHQIDNHVGQECEAQANEAYANFNELTPSNNGDQLYEKCIETAYQLGCLGAKVKEECGEGGFGVYKHLVRKVGIFKSGICSSSVMRTIKTSFIDSLDMLESRKNVYRVVADLRKRRK